MPNFHFRYVDSAGQTHDGEAEAEDRESLLHELRDKGAVLEVREAAPKAAAAASPAPVARAFASRRFSREDLSLFTRQMATMLNAGLPIMKVIAILRKRCSNLRLAEILDGLSQGVREGGRFSDCLSKYPDIFDGLYVNLIRVGEASGKMAPLVDELAMLLDKEAALRRRVQSALAYPLFILIFTVVLAWVIVAFLMPLFIPVFASSGLNLREDYPLTYWLIQTTHFVNDRSHIVLAIGLAIAALVGVRRVAAVARVQALVERIMLALPVVGPMLLYAASSRFARTLSTLMGSGMPLLQTLPLVSGAVASPAVAGAVDRVAQQLTHGRRLSDAIEMENRVFPDLIIQMAQVGEEAGALPQMLARAADYYESQLDLAVQRLIALLEPAMMLVVGGVVCTFIMAVLLPILGLAQAR